MCTAKIRRSTASRRGLPSSPGWRRPFSYRAAPRETLLGILTHCERGRRIQSSGAGPTPSATKGEERPYSAASRHIRSTSSRTAPSTSTGSNRRSSPPIRISPELACCASRTHSPVRPCRSTISEPLPRSPIATGSACTWTVRGYSMQPRSTMCRSPRSRNTSTRSHSAFPRDWVPPLARFYAAVTSSSRLPIVGARFLAVECARPESWRQQVSTPSKTTSSACLMTTPTPRNSLQALAEIKKIDVDYTAAQTNMVHLTIYDRDHAELSDTLAQRGILVGTARPLRLGYSSRRRCR